MPTSKIDILKDRAAMLAQARKFFADRNVLEVDCPILSASACIDAHIDLIPASPYSEPRHMHSSPEYGMKRLLSEGMGDIYQLSHVFRDGECGVKHNPEFTMAEWYRLGMPFTDLISETMDFIRLFIGQLSARTISYRQAFRDYADLDYLTAKPDEILHCLSKHHIEAYSEVINEGRDALLNLVLGTIIEPQLGHGELCALAYYPASQAALAQTIVVDGEAVCERFEIYYQGIELCNGYHELADPIEQRKRLEDSNKMRIKLGKNTLPIDEFFLKALKKGLPDCCGVAVGFDRLMMLRHQEKHIKDVISFDWETA